MRATAAISTHPVAAMATGEAVGQLLEAQLDRIGVLCCFVTSAHAGALEDILGALDTILGPDVLVGAAAAGVVGPAAVVDEGPGLVLWAATMARATPVRFGDAQRSPPPPGTHAVVLLADPASSADAPWLDDLVGMEVAGTLVAPPRAAGGSVLAVNGHLQRNGAVGFALGVGAGVQSVLCPGSRPIGPSLTVTRAEGPLIYELDGIAARARLERLARDELRAGDIAFINRGLDLAVPAANGSPRFAPPALYPVAGADPKNGAIGLGEGGLDERLRVAEGALVQFHVRDPAVEATDLARAVTVPPAGAALLFPSSSPALAFPDALAGSGTPMAGCRGLAALGAHRGTPFDAPGSPRATVHRACAAVACFYDRELGRASQPPQG